MKALNNKKLPIIINDEYKLNNYLNCLDFLKIDCNNCPYNIIDCNYKTKNICYNNKKQLIDIIYNNIKER